MPVALDELLTIAEHTLSAAGAAHALIGGCARNVYAPPRSTRDVDLAVALTREQYAQIASALRGLGFIRHTETRTDDQSATPDVALFSDETGGRIDLLIAHTDFEHRAIERATVFEFAQAGLRVPVVRMEDLIIYKILAGRPHDLMDIEDVVNAQEHAGHATDWVYVEHECAEWEAADALHAIRERIARNAGERER